MSSELEGRAEIAWNKRGGRDGTNKKIISPKAEPCL